MLQSPTIQSYTSDAWWKRVQLYWFWKWWLTFIVLLNDRCKAKMDLSIITFAYANWPYPSRGLYENTLGITYRASQERWIVSSLFANQLYSSYINRPLPNVLLLVMCANNCSTIKLTLETQAVLKRSQNLAALSWIAPWSWYNLQITFQFSQSKWKGDRWDKQEMDLIKTKMWADVWKR